MKHHPYALAAIAFIAFYSFTSCAAAHENLSVNHSGYTQICTITEYKPGVGCMLHCPNGSDYALSIPKNRCTIGAQVEMPNFVYDLYELSPQDSSGHH